MLPCYSTADSTARSEAFLGKLSDRVPGKNFVAYDDHVRLSAKAIVGDMLESANIHTGIASPGSKHTIRVLKTMYPPSFS